MDRLSEIRERMRDYADSPYDPEVDSAFCGSALEDIPYLLAEVERLRRVEQAARAVKDCTSDGNNGSWVYRHEMWQALDALRAALAEPAPTG